MMSKDVNDTSEGIENHSATNVYEYRDTPPPKAKRNLSPSPNPIQQRSASTPSSRTGSNTSLKDIASFSPTGAPTHNQQRRPKPRTHLGEGGVPQTEV